MTFTLRRRKSRRHTPRHIALLSAPENEETLPEAVRRIEAEDEAAAMTQAIPHGMPDGTRWAEDVPVIRQPMRRTGPQASRTPTGPQRAVRTGADPYAAPVTRTGPNSAVRYAPQDRPRGTRHTEAWTADFAETGRRPRPYAPANNPQRHLLGLGVDGSSGVAALRRRPPFPDTWRPRPTARVRERMDAITYPAADASPSEVAAFMRRISLITGTRSTFEQSARCVAWARGITEGAA